MSLNGFSRVLLSTENESHSVSGNGGKKNLWGLLFRFMHSCGLGLTESLFGVRMLGQHGASVINPLSRSTFS